MAVYRDARDRFKLLAAARIETRNEGARLTGRCGVGLKRVPRWLRAEAAASWRNLCYWGDGVSNGLRDGDPQDQWLLTSGLPLKQVRLGRRSS